jgi:hypothetical protein
VPTIESTKPKQTRPWGFQPGKSGNPAGRKKGSRHVALRALDAIGEAGAEAALRAVVDAAAGGDIRAAEILLRRVWPERKGRPVQISLPQIKRPEDIVVAVACVAQAAASGLVSPEEARDLVVVCEAVRRAIETADLASRIDVLEGRLADGTEAADGLVIIRRDDPPCQP